MLKIAIGKNGGKLMEERRKRFRSLLMWPSSRIEINSYNRGGRNFADLAIRNRCSPLCSKVF
jgi:hypothetical protein